jgi:hypothetical protein
MKLAEALNVRADYQRRLQQLRSRMTQNARVQEGEEPAEDPNTLLDEYARLAADLRRLVQDVNRTNASTEVDPGRTIADAIAERDELQLLHSMYRDLASGGATRQDRLTRSEVRFVSSVNVSSLQRQADDFARRYRELDTRIQELNWSTELIER